MKSRGRFALWGVCGAAAALALVAISDAGQATNAEAFSGSQVHFSPKHQSTVSSNATKMTTASSSKALATTASKETGAATDSGSTPSSLDYSGSVLLGVSCPSTGWCMAVGYTYASLDMPVPLTELWNGSSWSLENTPDPTGSIGGGLLGISCPTSSFCTAVGGYYPTAGPEQTLEESWNGSSWSVQDAPQPAGSTGAELAGVSCPSASVCAAVGHYVESSGPVTLSEIWDGTNWSIQTTPNPTGTGEAFLYAVSCGSSDSCQAVGQYSGQGGLLSLAEGWDGNSWTIEPTPITKTLSSGSSPTDLLGVSCISQNACTAVGGANPYQPSQSSKALDSALAETWDGSNWTIDSTPTLPASSNLTEQLSSVSCWASFVCNAVGSDDNQVTKNMKTLGETGLDGSYFRDSTDESPASTTDLLHGVSCASLDSCVAVGYYKLSSGSWSTLAERWNGVDWTVDNIPSPSTSDAAAAPTCAAPAEPAATYPPGQNYGVPFKAEVTGGQVFSGYDEWMANNNQIEVGNTEESQFPWRSQIAGITGWVTGLLEIPSLTGEISAQDFSFCDQGQGGDSCQDGAVVAPPGQCIHFTSQGRPAFNPNFTRAIANSPPVSNEPMPGYACFAPVPTGVVGCTGYDLSFTPTGDTTLTVTGVEPDGSLDLSVTSGAITSVSYMAPATGEISTATQVGSTEVTLSTQAGSLPSEGPSTPTNLCTYAGETGCNTDYRSLRVSPSPLTGPLESATSMTSGDNFGVPAFEEDGSQTGGITEALNGYANGWGTSVSETFGCYMTPLEAPGSPNPPSCPPLVQNQVADPGWTQFSASTNVVNLGLPNGPPSGFDFSQP